MAVPMINLEVVDQYCRCIQVALSHQLGLILSTTSLAKFLYISQVFFPPIFSIYDGYGSISSMHIMPYSHYASCSEASC